MKAQKILAGIAVLAVCSPLMAAVVTTALIKDFSASTPRVYRAPLTLERGRLRIDTTGFTGASDPTEVIYRSDQRKIWQIDHADKSYLELDEGMLVSMSEGMDSAIRAIKDYINGDAPADATTDLKVKETGVQRRILGLDCRRYDILRDQARIQEVWLASWSQSGITEEQFRVVKELGRSYEKIWSALGSAPVLKAVPLIPLENIIRLDGYPLIIRHYQKGQLRYEITLGAPGNRPDSAARFEIPAGYRKRLF